MRTTLLLVLSLLLLSAADAGAVGDRLVIASDLSATNFCVSDNTVTTSVYVIHTGPPQASGSRFSVLTIDSYQGGSMSMSVVGVDFYANLYLGSIETGVDVLYVGCKPLPYVVCRIDYVGDGTSAPCSVIGLAPRAGDPSIDGVDCDGTAWPADCTGTYVNSDGNCYCYLGAACPSPVASEPATWGAIKSLYRQ